MTRKQQNPFEKQVEIQRRVQVPNENSATPSRRGKKGTTVYFDPDTHRMLRQLALDKDTSVHALLHESVEILLGKYGKSLIK